MDHKRWVVEVEGEFVRRKGSSYFSLDSLDKADM